jgi:hypothetical protein
MPEEFADYRKDNEVHAEYYDDDEPAAEVEEAAVPVPGAEGVAKKDIGVHCEACHRFHPSVIKGTKTEDEMWRGTVRASDQGKMFFCSPVCYLAMALKRGVKYHQLASWEHVERVYYARNKHRFTRTDMLRHRRLYLHQCDLLLTAR